MYAMYGPEVSQRHDLTLLRNRIREKVFKIIMLIDGPQYYIFADDKYNIRSKLPVPFPNVALTLQPVEFNRAMSAVPVVVQWNYRDVKLHVASNYYAQLLRVRQVPVAVLYICPAILFNFKVSIYKSSQIGRYFLCKAPSVAKYLSSE